MKTLQTLDGNRRATYAAPRLKRYGKVSKLTLKTGSSTDSGFPGFGDGGGGTN